MQATRVQVSSARLMVSRLGPRLPSAIFCRPAALPCTHCMASATERLQQAGHELKEGARQTAEKVRAGTRPFAQSCSVLAVRAAWLTCWSSTGLSWRMQ